MKTKNKDIIIEGLALFAMFFGAGNLLFPTFLGLESSKSWIMGFGGFILADVGLTLLACIAAAKCEGNISDIFNKVGKGFAIVLGVAIMVCLGPLLAIPRTAATTFELGIIPLFDNFNPVIFSIIFFIITLLLSIKPSKVVDIIGQFLTPLLFITLIILIAVGIFNPIGDITLTSRVSGVFAEGVAQGYQTMDALGAIALSAVIMSSLREKGYSDSKEKIKITFTASLIAGIGLIIVYGGLAYLGATISSQYANIALSDISQTALIVNITSQILGNPGKLLLALIIGLACLTTAIGLTSATGQYFENLTKGKVKYETVVIIVCTFSAFVSNFGVSSIINFSGPILSIIYPPTIAIIIITLFKEKITNENVYKCAVYMALLISVLTALEGICGLNISFMKDLPFAKLGFNWVIPVVVAGVIGKYIPSKVRKAIYNS